MNTNHYSSANRTQEDAFFSQTLNGVFNGGYDSHAQTNGEAHPNGHAQVNGHNHTNGDTLPAAAHADANEYLNGHTHVHKNYLNGHSTGKTNGENTRFNSSRDPIAICGMAMRLPGGINDAEGFWDALYNGKDLRSAIPPERYNAKAFSDALGKKGAIKTQYGYFLNDDLSHLDASFFSMTKTDLERTDPQQRQMLEVTRECLENAGEVNWRGKAIGCYVGTFGEDWLHSMSKENQFTGAFAASGDLMIANRVSYEFDFKGPRYEKDECA